MQTISDVIDMIIAYALVVGVTCLPPGRSRTKHLYPMSIIAVASCLVLQMDLDRAHVLEGLMAFLGLLGAAMIVCDHFDGLLDAAALWLVGCIGAAVGGHRYPMACGVAILGFVGLRIDIFRSCLGLREGGFKRRWKHRMEVWRSQ